MATVITIVNYNCTVITIVNFNPKTFIVQATDKNSFENLKKFFFIKISRVREVANATNVLRS
jgi:hypothetical protein